ncbi:MAG TPA: FAD binding domain-containing protein [Streptosporangiaceae bacterium]|nr:FAD binding domain-containing protein [Streptosporangiaceae bacterium]
MEFLQPAEWQEALRLKAERPEAKPIMGGTDVMVELNTGRLRPRAMLDLSGLPDLQRWDFIEPSPVPDSTDGGCGAVIRVGAAMTYQRVIDELAAHAPALAQAARAVGSPQIRNRGTLGGSLGTASPSGDSHAPLLALGAVIEVASAARGTRLIDAGDFYAEPAGDPVKPDELIRAIRLPAATGPQYFAKVGRRNAMAVAVCSFAVALWPARRSVGTGVGAAGPTPVRASDAEQYLAAELDWQAPLHPRVARTFGELAAASIHLSDDARATARYRRHALAVISRRALTWAWDDHRRVAVSCA